MKLFSSSPGARRNIAHWFDPGAPGRTERFHADWLWWWWLIITIGDNDVDVDDDDIVVTTVLGSSGAVSWKEFDQLRMRHASDKLRMLSTIENEECF